jgi:nitronate monooxygenase
MTTALTSLLGLKHPIIQAPMAGGSCTPELVAAVSRAGALGSFGFAYTEPAAMIAQAEAARRLTNDPAMPIGINLFVAPAPDQVAPDAVKRAAAYLKPVYDEFGLPLPESVQGPFAPDFGRQVEAVLAIRPALVSAHLNVFPDDAARAMKARGIKLTGSATNVDEAKKLEAMGYDVIIAQGAEAGGHRGTFLGAYEDSMIGTLALTRLIARTVRVPVVAAGGIMDGAGIAAALSLGAAGAQLGTAFLTCAEAGTQAPYRRALLEDKRPTAITTAFSGRPARGIKNRFVEVAAAAKAQPLPFPAQNSMTLALRGESARRGSPEAMSLWAGQAFTLSRQAGAADLIEALMREARDAAAEAERALRS